MPWKAGQSGNPSGRPKVITEIRDLAQQHGKAAFNRIIDLMSTSSDERVRLAAAQEVLNRAYGKPAQAVTGEGGEGPLVVKIVRFSDEEGEG